MREIVSTITSKGQVTIPVEVRRHLGVGTTDKVTFVLEDDGRVELRPARFTVAALRGVVPPLPGCETVDFEDQINEALNERVDEIVRRLERR
ncbi:MAG: AbrB/MazE/SpoVT family DNA-binding domain-containing protein [Thermomicrobiales bacterium]